MEQAQFPYSTKRVRDAQLTLGPTGPLLYTLLMPLSDKQIEKARVVAHSSPLALAVFETLASRARAVDTTDLTRLRQQLQKERGILNEWAALLAPFQKLQAAGFGKVLQPRNPVDHPRFQWDYDYVELASRALGKERRRLAPAAPADAALPPGIVMRSFVVSGRLELRIKLPVDITNEELKELARQIDALAEQGIQPAQPRIVIG